MSLPSRERQNDCAALTATRKLTVSPQDGNSNSMNWPGKQRATGNHGDQEPYVCPGGYLQEFEDGRVECPLCGRGAYSRNQSAIRQWEMAHDRCCVRRAPIAATA